MEGNRGITLLQHSSASLRAMSCSGDASYGDFASCACGACAWQFSLCVFFERAHSGFSDSRVGIKPSNSPRCNSLLCLRHQALTLKRRRMDDAVELLPAAPD